MKFLLVIVRIECRTSNGKNCLKVSYSFENNNQVALIGVVAFAAGQPVDEAAAPAAVVPVDEASVIAVAEANPDQETMEASGSALKIIEHKLEHWLKKCYKKGGCGSTGTNA
jgi:hypothetical protein